MRSAAGLLDARTQSHRYTTTKTARSVKKVGKTSSVITAGLSNRKGSKKALMAPAVKEDALSDDDFTSNKSAKTHIIDEVLHQ